MRPLMTIEPPEARWRCDDILHEAFRDLGFGLNSVTAMNLTGDILPVFADRWVGSRGRDSDPNDEWIVKSFYDQSLRLASNFITCPLMDDWWDAIMRGWELSPTRWSPMLVAPAATDFDAATFVRNRFSSIGEYLKFAFNDASEPYDKWSCITEINRRYQINLHSTFERFAKAVANQQDRDANMPIRFPGPGVDYPEHEGRISGEQQLRMRWLLAITLCRELCNLMWVLRKGKEQHPFHYLDPRYKKTRSLADAWEFFTFGFVTKEAPLYSYVDAHRENYTQPYNPDRTTMVASFSGADGPFREMPDAICPLPIQSIAGWFQNATWHSVWAGHKYDCNRFLPRSSLVLILRADGWVAGYPE